VTFDTVLMVDWSGGNDRGPTPKKDAIWVCAARGGVSERPLYMRNRQVAEKWITGFIDAERTAGRRVMVGFDFAFGYPEGFGKALTDSDDPLAVWDWFEARVQDAPDANNRFDIAAKINAQFAGIGPFWGNGLKRDIPHLPRKGLDRTCKALPEKRVVETRAKGAFAVWQLSGAGAVGSQVIMGLPSLARLRRRYGAELAVWPFQPLDKPIALVEIWPSLVNKTVSETMPQGEVKDAHQVRVMAEVISGLPDDEMTVLLDVPATAEGWILGVGNTAILAHAAKRISAPPQLKNDCFAMPQGAHWTPVDTALAHLRSSLTCVTGTQSVTVAQASGRYLAADVVAVRAHPPAPNAAVDGYGFAGPAHEGRQEMPLVKGRAAAGTPYERAVPAGHAIPILTGANIPDGVDTVILQEDVSLAANSISFYGPLRQGANARAAGEDMHAGQVIATAGRRVTAGDIGTFAAAGVGRVTVHKRLRVGVLSTGDELVDPGGVATDAQIYDANGPMLSALVEGWGFDLVDLGRAPDDRETLRKMLDKGASHCDAILTSGGASAGAEDHMSALLQGTGSFALWRIAMKPGRPLALGMWGQTPVFGLPGNPVAAMVCALVFARPALGLLAGGGWKAPAHYLVPANFTKSKKAGRREYLRARITGDGVEIFPSEGSGRVSGLSWATGLVELADGAQTIAHGDPVRFIPFASFDQ